MRVSSAPSTAPGPRTIAPAQLARTIVPCRRITGGVVLGLAGIGCAGAATIDEYRFENDLADSANGARAAVTLQGTPGFSNNAPTDVLGIGNTASLSLGTTDALRFNYAFPFQTLVDSTVEFFLYPYTLGPEQDLFWTTTDPGDTNRFNLGLAGASTFFIDYRQSDGTLHSLGNAAGLTANAWNFIAVVKRGANYSIHINGQAPVVSVDSNPVLPTSTAWTLNGRAAAQPLAGLQFAGLVDNLRISDQALDPSEFLSVGAIFRDGYD